MLAVGWLSNKFIVKYMLAIGWLLVAYFLDRDTHNISYRTIVLIAIALFNVILGTIDLVNSTVNGKTLEEKK